MERVNLPMRNYAQFSFGLHQLCSLTWVTGEINCLVPETLCSPVECLCHFTNGSHLIFALNPPPQHFQSCLKPQTSEKNRG